MQESKNKTETFNPLSAPRLDLMTEDLETIAHWLPWAGRNLCRNPFGELSRAERAEVAVVDLDSIAARLAKMRSAVQLIGDCGRGKTTRMLALAQRFPESSYVYLPEDGPCPAIAEGNPLLIDEAQRLPRAVCATHSLRPVCRWFGDAPRHEPTAAAIRLCRPHGEDRRREHAGVGLQSAEPTHRGFAFAGRSASDCFAR